MKWVWETFAHGDVREGPVDEGLAAVPAHRQDSFVDAGPVTNEITVTSLGDEDI